MEKWYVYTERSYRPVALNKPIEDRRMVNECEVLKMAIFQKWRDWEAQLLRVNQQEVEGRWKRCCKETELCHVPEGSNFFTLLFVLLISETN
jgi:hypothetical protein